MLLDLRGEVDGMNVNHFGCSTESTNSNTLNAIGQIDTIAIQINLIN